MVQSIPASSDPIFRVVKSRGFGGAEHRFESRVPEVVTPQMQFLLTKRMTHSIFVSFLMLIMITIILAFMGPGSETDPELIEAKRTRSAMLVMLVLFLGFTFSIWINFIRDSDALS